MKVKNIMFSGFAAAIFAGVCGAADAAVQYELTSKSYVDTELAKKQDNLSAGTGISIENNVVKSTLDLTPFATITDMQAADQALQGKIDAEASARANADSALDGKITAMDAAYKSADTGLQSQIDAVKELTGTEGVADQISAAVSAEASARAQADAQIRTDFAAADTALDGKITAEASAREAADTAISNKIGTVAEGKTVVDMIADAQTAATYDDTAVRGLISAEATARENADTAMDTRVATAEGEIDDLQAADTTIRSEFADADAQVLANAKADATTKANAAQAAAEATADAALTAYKTANDPKVNKNTEDIAGINAELETLATSETVTNLTTRVATAEGEIDDLVAADTAIRGEFADADAQVLADAKAYADQAEADAISTAAADATTKADAVKDLVNDGNFVSANGILSTKGGYLVISDGFGNITLNQVAVVNGDGTTDIITGESL